MPKKTYLAVLSITIVFIILIFIPRNNSKEVTTTYENIPTAPPELEQSNQRYENYNEMKIPVASEGGNILLPRDLQNN